MLCHRSILGAVPFAVYLNRMRLLFRRRVLSDRRLALGPLSINGILPPHLLMSTFRPLISEVPISIFMFPPSFRAVLPRQFNFNLTKSLISKDQMNGLASVTAVVSASNIVPTSKSNRENRHGNYETKLHFRIVICAATKRALR